MIKEIAITDDQLNDAIELLARFIAYNEYPVQAAIVVQNNLRETIRFKWENLDDKFL